MEGLGVGVVVVDGQGTILYRNAFAATALAVGETLDAAFAGVRWGEAFGGWRGELLRAAEPCAVVRLSGSVGGESATTLHLRCSALPSKRNEPRRFALLIETGEASAESPEQVEVSRRLASLGKLAARVAHELNNPLDGILRYINLSLRIAAEAPEPKLQSYLSESRTGLMRMIQIIGDLLQFSRASDASFDAMGVNEVIEEAIRVHAGAADRNRVVVAADFQVGEMPEVRGSRLYQIVCNLIRNAIDAMPGGGRLTITSRLAEGDVLIRVADTGVGLPEPIDKVFEPFFTTKQPGKGSGLGLAICKEFIEDMGGTIAAAPGVEGGAVFTVRVPAAGLTGPTRIRGGSGESEGENPGRRKPR